MNKKIPLTIAALFLIAIIVSAFLLYPSEKYAIIVNNEKLTLESFNSAMENEIHFAKTRGEELNEEAVKTDLIEKMIERMTFSAYLSSLNIEITSEDLDKIYETIIEDTPNISTKEDLHREWREQGRNIEIIEKQIKEDLAYEKLFEKYFEEVEIPDEEVEMAYKEHMEGVEEFGWDVIEKEDLEFYLRHNKTHNLIDEERKSFEENIEIKVLI